MPANTQPIFPLTPNIGYGKVLTANTALDGTGTLVTCFTAGANGSIVDSLTIVHLGINVATVLRLFIKDGLNYTLFFEETIAANTTLSQVAKSVYYEYIFDPTNGSGTNKKRLSLKPNALIVASVGTTIAAGVQCTLIGGDY